jgi:hypothetical protein
MGSYQIFFSEKCGDATQRQPDQWQLRHRSGQPLGDRRHLDLVLVVRLDGTRVKHVMKTNRLNMYDKAGRVLRIETVNDPTEFRVRCWQTNKHGGRPLEPGIDARENGPQHRDGGLAVAELMAGLTW